MGRRRLAIGCSGARDRGAQDNHHQSTKYSTESFATAVAMHEHILPDEWTSPEIRRFAETALDGSVFRLDRNYTIFATSNGNRQPFSIIHHFDSEGCPRL
jgi:hypothetical protein